MGGQQSSEQKIERWLKMNKRFDTLIQNNGFNSHLSIGLFQLAVSNIPLQNGTVMENLEKAISTYQPHCFIITYFPALVVRQSKEIVKYLECFVVLDQISLLISCRTPVEVCCGGGNSKDFDLRISLLRIEDIKCEGDILSITHSNNENNNNQQITLKLPNGLDFVSQLKSTCSSLFGSTYQKKWLNIPPQPQTKDFEQKQFSKLFLVHLFDGPITDLDNLKIPQEWTTTSPSMPHTYSIYYQPRHKPSLPAPQSKELLTIRPPGQVTEYAILSRSRMPNSQNWYDIPISQRIGCGYPSFYLPTVASAINHTLCQGHSKIGDPREISILALHGQSYSQCLQPNDSKGQLVLEDYQVTSGGLVWGGTKPRSKPLPYNPKIVRALLRAISSSNWVEVLSFHDCYLDDPHYLQMLNEMANVCRFNTSLTSISFPPRSGPLNIQNLPQFQNAWKEISEALCSNTRSVISSIDLSNCFIGDTILQTILPALKKLFSRGSLVSIKFTNNGLSGVSISSICDALLGNNLSEPFLSLKEISFGGNPWCSDPNQIPIKQICTILSLSPMLQILNLESTSGVFPLHLIKTVLMNNDCPLECFVIGGFKVNQNDAFNFVRSVIDIGNSKVSTLKFLSLHCLELDIAAAVEIIHSLGPVEIDFSEGGIGKVYNVSISPQSRVIGLNLRNTPVFTLSWWMGMPQNIIELNFSCIVADNHPDLFQRLSQVLSSSPVKLSLQSLNISNIVTVPQSVAHLLEVCLLCPMIQIQKIDISGCRLGDLGLQCLGYCLRKNRTLTTLKLEGQGATVNGWAAFRGCLYGNKKLINVPYPYADVIRFFEEAQRRINEGYNKLPSIQPHISAAYRQRNHHLMQQFINQKVAIKVEYKEWERAIGRFASTFQEIFNSIEQNMKDDFVMKQQKSLLKLQSPKIIDAKQKIVLKESKLIYQILNILEKHRNSSDWQSQVYYWNEVDEMIRSTTFLFISRNFSRFKSLLGYIFIPTFPESLKTVLLRIHSCVRNIEVKSTVWGQNVYEVARDLLQYSNNIMVPYMQYQFVPKPVIVKTKNNKKKDDNDGEGPDSEQFDHNSPDAVYYDDRNQYGHHHHHHHHDKDKNDKNKDDKDKDNGDKDIDKNDEYQDDDKDNGDKDIDKNDEYQDDDKDDGDKDIDKDNGDKDFDKDDGNDNDNTFEAVEMYGGAGPQDLPDGGPDNDPSSGTVPCPIIITSSMESIKFVPNEKHSQYQLQKQNNQKRSLEEYEKNLEKCLEKCPTLFSPLDYEVEVGYATICGLSGDCTLITQCSVDRFSQLEEQIKVWRSGVSVSIYIPSFPEEEKESCLKKVNELIVRLKSLKSFVVISLLYGHECDSMKGLWDLMNPDLEPELPLYPINNLRNLSVIAAKSTMNSPLMFLVDVDFIPSSGLSSWIEESKCWMISKCDEGKVFVVPAFECEEDNFEIDQNNPKKSVIEGLECGFLTPFHVSHFQAGHQSTNYSRWKESLIESNNNQPNNQSMKGEMLSSYPVSYEEFYEPYIIISQKKFIPYDERFRGYGMNKCIQVKELSMRGVEFRVLKEHYLIALKHNYSPSHKQTYSKKSKFRRFVIAKLYEVAKKEFGDSEMQSSSLSNTTNEWMRMTHKTTSSSSISRKSCVNVLRRFVEAIIGKKEKLLKEKFLTIQSQNNTNHSFFTVSSFEVN